MMIVCFVFEYTPESQRLINKSISYEVTVIPGENGTVTTDKSIAESGSIVTVSAVPEKGYAVSVISVIDVYGNYVAVNGNTFIMPDSEVSVEVSFVKTVPNPEKVKVGASVNLEGKALADKEFKFDISYFENGERVIIETVRSSKDGSVDFAALVFFGACDYTFYIRQLAGEDSSIEYDSTVYAINIKVVWGKDGYLKATVTKPDDIVFNNVYTAPEKITE